MLNDDKQNSAQVLMKHMITSGYITSPPPLPPPQPPQPPKKIIVMLLKWMCRLTVNRDHVLDMKSRMNDSSVI